MNYEQEWCVRDNYSKFLIAEVVWNLCTCSVIEAEALNLKEAIQKVIQMQINHIILENDSQVVVHEIQENKGNVVELSLIISCIKNLLDCNSNFEVKFVKRQMNIVAHLLVKAVNSCAPNFSFDSSFYCATIT